MTATSPSLSRSASFRAMSGAKVMCDPALSVHARVRSRQSSSALRIGAIALVCSAACGRTELDAESRANPTDSSFGGAGGSSIAVGGQGAAAGRGGAPLSGGSGGGAGAAPVASVQTCPSTNATGVGTNSWVSVEGHAASNAAAPPTLAVTCDGVIVSGHTATNADHVAFVPDALLPENASCVAMLTGDTLDANGLAIDSAVWKFVTGNIPQTSFTWSSPKQIGGRGYVAGLAADGDDLVASWTTPLSVAVSRDNGQTFGAPITVVTPDNPYISPVLVALSGGIAHVAWRAIPGDTGFGYYTRLLDGLSRADTPLQLTTPGGSTNIVSVALGFDGDQQVRLAWDDYSCAPNCSLGEYAVWASASQDGGASFSSLGRLDQHGAGSPAIAWTSSGMLTAWIENNHLVVHDDAGTQLASLSETGEMLWPFTFLQLAGGRALLSWREGPGIGVQITYLSRFEQGAFTEPRELIREPDGETEVSSSFGASSGDALLWLTSVGNVFGPAQRSVRLSSNAGDTFAAPQVLDFLHDAYGAPDGSDTFCPVVALGSGGVAHLLWQRGLDDTGPTQILYAKGTPSTPCGF